MLRQAGKQSSLQLTTCQVMKCVLCYCQLEEFQLHFLAPQACPSGSHLTELFDLQKKIEHSGALFYWRLSTLSTVVKLQGEEKRTLQRLLFSCWQPTRAPRLLWKWRLCRRPRGLTGLYCLTIKWPPDIDGLAYRPFHFHLYESVKLYSIFHRELFCKWLHKATYYQREGI